MLHVVSGQSQWVPEIFNHGRTQVHVPVTGEVVISRGPLNIFARICDISIGGARLSMLTEIMRPGQALTLQVRVDGRRLTGKNTAEVRWMSPRGRGAWNVGIEFSVLVAKDLNAIADLIAAKLSA